MFDLHVATPTLTDVEDHLLADLYVSLNLFVSGSNGSRIQADISISVLILIALFISSQHNLV